MEVLLGFGPLGAKSHRRGQTDALHSVTEAQPPKDRSWKY